MATAILIPRTVAQVLRDSPLPLLRTLSVTESDQEVTLTGCVNSYYYKQLAQEAILPFLGRRRLKNQVVVRPES